MHEVLPGLATVVQQLAHIAFESIRPVLASSSRPRSCRSQTLTLLPARIPQVDEELPGLAAAMQRAPPPVEVGDALGFLPAAHGEQRVGWRPVEWMELHSEYVKEVGAHAAQVCTCGWPSHLHLSRDFLWAWMGMHAARVPEKHAGVDAHAARGLDWWTTWCLTASMLEVQLR